MSFWSSLTGQDAADAALKGAGQQQAYIGRGMQQQQGAYDQALGGYQQFLSPSMRQAYGLAPLEAGAGSGQAYGNDPYSQLRAASGALGPEAQAQFHQNFQESPGTQYLREQGMAGINANAGATGGLGGGARLKAMSEFNQNLANQQMNQRLSQLGGLAQQDYATAGQLGNMRMGLGNSQAAGYSDMGSALSQGTMNAANAKAAGAGNLFGAATGLLGAGIGGMGGLSGMFGGGAGGAGGVQGAALHNRAQINPGAGGMPQNIAQYSYGW